MSSSSARRLRRLIAAGVAGVLATTIGSLPAAGAESQPRDPSGEAIEVPETGIEADRRAEVLGVGAMSEGDRAFVAMGGPDGVAILRGEAGEGYRWERIARLGRSGVETDQWIANSCVDPEQTHLAVVYAPRTFTNDERNFLGGAWGAIVDLESGAVTDLGRGYSLAHFNPGCGGGAFAAFTRYTDDGGTQLASVDLRTGAARAKVEVTGQLTPATTDSSGGLVAVADGAIVRVADDGSTAALAEPTGHPFALRVDGRDRLAFLSMDSAERSSAQRVDLTVEKTAPVELATGALDELGLARAGDALFVLGNAEPAAQITPPGVVFLPGAGTAATVSSNGLLAIGSVSPAGIASRFGGAGDVGPSIDAVATQTATELRFIVDPSADASLTTSDNDRLTVTEDDEPRAAPAMLDVRPIGTVHASTTVTKPTSNGYPIDEARTCAVPRNDPANQAYQPEPRQVQWAVDRAVLGQLHEKRPANWRNLGMAEYAAQTMFPRVALSGGGTIPPQILLGVLAQESNLWQASRYTAPGSTGNPIIGDFYGSRPETDEPDNVMWDIDFSDADCGYGIGQITDGMRLAGRERPDDVPALPWEQQRAIALDYTANIAMAARMLAQKWNEVKAAGMDINDGDANRIENWFVATWAYNSGFHPKNGGKPWGVGWLNNPVNPLYPANRASFLDGSPSDAANPQWWPYPEKVLGFAAHSLDLPQTQMADVAHRTYPTDYVAAFTTAWWSGEGTIGIENRTRVKPPIDLFCSLNVNQCDPGRAFPCTIEGEPECWWHTDAVWKPDCDFSCGWGQERFDYGDYPTEADSMKSTLPPVTRQLSFPPNCAAPPTGVIVVDDVLHQPAVDGCARKPTEGSFDFTFFTPDANGNYSGKIDLHQQGGGYNGHFSWSHMRGDGDAFENVNDRLKITGRWSLDRQLHQWTRVWVHLPNHAAWTEQAAYEIDLGNGQKRTRYLPQRRYENGWVPLGVFDVQGVPAVSLSNKVTKATGVNVDDVAWDSVGFQPLDAKPKDFVVALGDSYSSGEGAGDYAAWSDHDGDDEEFRNGCHQSSNAWIRKTTLPGDGSSIGDRIAANSTGLDFHFLACSGAETKDVLPGGQGQFGLVSQLDSGYLDENTTLVTLSIGGNDMRFGDIITACALQGECQDKVLGGDSTGMLEASRERLASVLPQRLDAVIEQVSLRSPHARIVLVGYPRLFDIGATCILVSDLNMPWLNEVSDGLREVIAEASASPSPTAEVSFADPQPAFQGRTLCTAESGLTGLVFDFTPGDKPFEVGKTYVSQQSVHPNISGSDMYARTVERELQEAQDSR